MSQGDIVSISDEEPNIELASLAVMADVDEATGFGRCVCLGWVNNGHGVSGFEALPKSGAALHLM